MLACRPFITMGGRNQLANLKRLGFQTFSDFWDEGYDEYGMQRRAHEILKLANTISQWPVEKMQQVLQDMQPNLEHNYKTFMSLTHTKIRQTFDE